MQTIHQNFLNNEATHREFHQRLFGGYDPAIKRTHIICAFANLFAVKTYTVQTIVSARAPSVGQIKGGATELQGHCCTMMYQSINGNAQPCTGVSAEAENPCEVSQSRLYAFDNRIIRYVRCNLTDRYTVSKLRPRWNTSAARSGRTSRLCRSTSCMLPGWR
jgi:hypothetical protein